MIRPRRPAFFIPWVLLMILSPSLAAAQTGAGEKTITVVGQTSSKDKDAAAAEQQAIANALTTAVDLAAIEMLTPEEAAARFPDLNQILPGNENDFIQRYEVLTDGASAKGRFRILVRATVSQDRIRARLDGLGAPPEPQTESPTPEASAGGPRLLLFVAEQQTERGPVHYWWRETEQTPRIVSEAAMVRVLSGAGFTVIPHEALFQDPESVARIRFNPYIEPGDAAVTARKLGAGAVIVGTAVARRSLDIMGEETRTFSATVSVRAFATDSGREIAEVTQTSVESHIDDAAGREAALLKAGEACAQALSGKLAAVLSKPSGKEGLRLIVGGTRNLGAFVAFRRALLNMDGVEAIRLLEMRTNEAVVQATYDGDGEALSKALTEKQFDAFSLKIYEAGPNEIRLELVAP